MRHEELSIGRLRVGELIPDYRQGARVPASGRKGYLPGHEFFLTNAVLGQCMKWVNVGDLTGCLFVPAGPVIGGYGFAKAGQRFCTTGSATQNFRFDDARASDIALGAYSVSDDTDTIAAVKVNDGNILWTLSADPLAAHDLSWAILRSRCTPEYDIFAAGTIATVGGDAVENIAITGVQAGDIGFATYSATDDTDTIAKCVCSANELVVTLSANPGTTHGLHYMVLRPRGSFKPSHYVAYAGSYTCLTGSATQAITVTGALATDIPIVNYKTTDDTDTVLKAVMTANTLTLTLSADPLAAHSVQYAILRAYPT